MNRRWMMLAVAASLLAYGALSPIGRAAPDPKAQPTAEPPSGPIQPAELNPFGDKDDKVEAKGFAGLGAGLGGAQSARAPELQIVRILAPASGGGKTGPPVAGKEHAAPAGPLNDAELSALLDRKVQIDVQEMRLKDFVPLVSERLGATLRLDPAALESIADKENAAVTLKISGISLRTALHLILRRLDSGLRLVATDGMLEITNEEQSARRLVRHVYLVGDLTRRPGGEVIDAYRDERLHAGEDHAEDLQDLIKVAILPDSWDDAGGAGCARMLDPDTLVVVQTGATQDDIAALLVALREVQTAQRVQPGGEPRRLLEATPDRRAEGERLRKKLASPVTIQFTGKPLLAALTEMGLQAGVEIQLDAKALEDVGAGEDSPVTIQLKKVSLRTALRLTLQSIDPTLTYSVQDGIVMVTTKEGAQQNLDYVVYPVHDLVEAGQAGGINQAQAQSLMDTIKATVESDSWDDAGGPGAVKYLATCGALTVAQTEEVQDQVAALLSDLRKARAGQQHAAAPQPLADDKVCVVAYHLQFLLPPDPKTAGVPLVSGVREGDLDGLKALIIQHVGADAWPAATTSIHLIGDRLVIRQTGAAQRKIHQLLIELNLLLSHRGQGSGGGFGGGVLRSVTPVVGEEVKAGK
ncbi:MAG: hypothetical protein K8T25_23360 [Planctomycetia bacterium]|nr:hypothetical protein [Planctomycetia bacterium]